MTSQSPRIYLYKITFEEVPYYYYGVHKEKKFNEYYMGSPYTHKWCWNFYTPKKQILQFFDFTDEGWLEANKIEQRIIKSFYSTDKWCLNENCGGVISLKLKSKIGKKIYKLKLGIHGLSKNERIKNAKKAGIIGGTKTYKNKSGIHAIPSEKKADQARKGHKKQKELKIGFWGLSTEKRSEIGKKGGSVSGKNHKKNKSGFFAISPEEKSEISKRGGTTTKEKNVGIFSIPYDKMCERNLKNSLQKWKCLETGFITNAGNLTKYQRKRGIDTTKRIKLE